MVQSLFCDNYGTLGRCEHSPHLLGLRMGLFHLLGMCSRQQVAAKSDPETSALLTKQGVLEHVTQADHSIYTRTSHCAHWTCGEVLTDVRLLNGTEEQGRSWAICSGSETKNVKIIIFK